MFKMCVCFFLTELILSLTGTCARAYRKLPCHHTHHLWHLNLPASFRSSREVGGGAGTSQVFLVLLNATSLQANTRLKTLRKKSASRKKIRVSFFPSQSKEKVERNREIDQWATKQQRKQEATPNPIVQRRTNSF